MAELNDLSDLEHEFPGWHIWVGVGSNLLYARRLRSSPPIVFRSETLDDLREQVRHYLVTGTPPWSQGR